MRTRSLNKKYIIILGAIVILTMIMPVNVFGAAINCDNINGNSCVGTPHADYMISTRASSVHGLSIDGLGGHDNIVADENKANAFGELLTIDAGTGNDLIEAKRIGTFRNMVVEGGSGDDSIELIAGHGSREFLVQGVFAQGQHGADKISVELKCFIFCERLTLVKLFQNGEDNTPDGSKDILDCHHARESTAYISVEDVDVALNCDHVITTQK